MENIVQEKIDYLLPYLRSFGFDDQMKSRFTVLLPLSWDYKNLLPLVVNSENNQNVSVTLIIGVQGEVEDYPIDYFFAQIGEMIDFNQREEKKRQLLQQKMEELQQLFQNSSLEEVETFGFVKGENNERIITQLPAELPMAPPAKINVVVEPAEIKVLEEIKLPPVTRVVSTPPPAKLVGKIVPISERDNDDEDYDQDIMFTPPIVADMERSRN